MIKKFIKKIVLSITGIPVEWIKYYYKQAKRFYRNSSASLNDEDIEWLITKIKVLTHELDKGLHMPEPKKGFGREKSINLVSYLRAYLKINNLDYEYDAYLDAVEILYKYCEAKDLYYLDISKIDLSEFPTDYSKMKGRLKETGSFKFGSELSKNILCFKDFALSRHSVRSFKPNCSVSNSTFERAVETARLAPSACNRQSSRVMLINDKKLAKKILTIQGGTRGFKNADNCVLIMSDLNSYWYDGEMNTAFVDAGIFTMNLIYSLTELGVSSCPLIWDDNSTRRNELNELIELPNNLLIVCVLAIGEADEKAKILFSPRKDTENIIVKVRRK